MPTSLSPDVAAAPLGPIRIAETDTCFSISEQTGVCDLVTWLGGHFPIEAVPQDRYREADYLLCDDFGFRYESFKGVRIFVTGENHAPDLNLYDYCLTHDYRTNSRCLRLPYWFHRVLLKPHYRQLLQNRPVITKEELLSQNREFCSFICRNHVCRVRNRFVRHLDARRRVNCAGPLYNNVGFLLPPGWEEKIQYQGRHMFAAAYENEASPGYTTEKILDAFVARTIPIYWGDPEVETEFNPDAFVHARRFRSEKQLIDYVLELADDTDRCLAMLNAPVFRTPDVPYKLEKELLSFMEGVFRRGPVVQRTRWQKINGVLSRYYGHGFFRTMRRVSRAIRGKKNNNLP